MSAPPGNGPADDVLNRVVYPMRDKLVNGLREAYSIAAMAANGVDCRLPAAREHADHLVALLEEFSGAPPTLVRRRQDQEMFELITNLVSAASCACVLACAVAAMFRGSPAASRCEKLYPDDVVAKFAQSFPNESLTGAIHRLTTDQLWSALKNLRAVLDHRGTLPRGFMGSGDPNVTGIAPQVAYVGSSPRDQARTHPYGWTLDRTNIFQYVDRIEQLIGDILREIPAFVESSTAA